MTARRSAARRLSRALLLIVVVALALAGARLARSRRAASSVTPWRSPHPVAAPGRRPEPAPPHRTESAAPPPTAPTRAIDPAAASPRPSDPIPVVSPAQAPHDLTVIDGIGPKIATVLEDAGIRSLQDLAGTAPDRLRELLAERGVRFAPSLVTWPDQAQRLIAGAV